MAARTLPDNLFARLEGKIGEWENSERVGKEGGEKRRGKGGNTSVVAKYKERKK